MFLSKQHWRECWLRCLINKTIFTQKNDHFLMFWPSQRSISQWTYWCFMRFSVYVHSKSVSLNHSFIHSPICYLHTLQGHRELEAIATHIGREAEHTHYKSLRQKTCGGMEANLQQEKKMNVWLQLKYSSEIKVMRYCINSKLWLEQHKIELSIS